MSAAVGDSRGSLWRRWDLHVHTPASVEQHFGDSSDDSTWDRYIQALSQLDPNIRVVGINDYFTVDGYRRVLAARQDGRLPNLDLILPVIELRLSTFVGSSVMRKLNFHVVFSDALSVDTIDQFFLARLNESLRLDDGKPWNGCLGTSAGLIDLGRAVKSATPAGKRTTDSDLRVGFANAAVAWETVTRALEQSVFAENYLTALGLSEVSQMRWDGAGTAQKRHATESVDFLFTASPSLESYRLARAKLEADELNARLIDASDAHYHTDSTEPNRLGRCHTWIKADPTFRGLRRALVRFDDRVFVGIAPPKLEKVRSNRTKYIREVEIRKKPDATLGETWFNSKLPLNYGLIAIIGNQGSGKSALTDVVALCGHSQNDGFSFLTRDKFRDKQKRASQFTATLTWEDGRTSEMTLDDDVPDTAVERVRYVPQGFFEGLTNETAVSVRGKFYGEIKKAIFSHVPEHERLSCRTLDDLIELHTQSADEEVVQLRFELKDLNRQIISVQASCAPSEIQKLDAEIDVLNEQLRALESSPPEVVPPPQDANPAADELTVVLEQLRQRRLEAAALEESRTTLAERKAIGTQAVQRLGAEERRFRALVAKVDADLTSAGIAINMAVVVDLRTDYQPLLEVLGELDESIVDADSRLDRDIPGSLANAIAALERRQLELQQQAESASSRYQAYLVSRAEWEQQIAALKGDLQPVRKGSLADLRSRRQELVIDAPSEIAVLEQQRREKSKEIFRALARLSEVHERIARPVREHIQRHSLTREHYRLSFDVTMSCSGLGDRLFHLVNQQGGTFAGVEKGRDALRALEVDADFTSAEGVAAFADGLLARLKNDYRRDPPTPIDLHSSLKKGMSESDVMDLVYSLEYLNPTFELGLNDKPLLRLSPGERGILLLVFYLVVDLGDEPLIVDQPEGNLNNQSIVDHLVPVIMSAKERRQILIVTHNPNIAVVCDAEQVVHCEMAQDGTHAVSYETGALENPRFNRLSLDLLEGTGPALDARIKTYELPEQRRGGSVKLPVFVWQPSGLASPVTADMSDVAE